MSNPRLPIIYFEDLTIGEIIAILDNGRGHGLCEQWHTFLPFKTDLKGAWDAMDEDQFETFKESLNLDISTCPPDLLNAIKPFIKPEKHEDLKTFLEDNLDNDWLQKSDSDFEVFKQAIFDAMKDILQTGGKVKLAHKKP